MRPVDGNIKHFVRLGDFVVTRRECLINGVCLIGVKSEFAGHAVGRGVGAGFSESRLVLTHGWSVDRTGNTAQS